MLIGLLSCLLYAMVYLTQRPLFLIGHSVEAAGTVFRGAPADRGRLSVALGGYYGATLALFALYAWLLLRCRRGQLADRRTQTIALLFPVLFNLGLLFGRPYFSIDQYSYVAQGYFGITPGFNPYLSPASAAANTPIGSELVRLGWRPVHGVAPYGPLWTQFEVMVARLGGDVPTRVLMMKTLIVLASLVCGVLIWLILGQVRPDDRLLGTLLYLWNPMIIVEFAAEGHNDPVMIAFVLLALLLCVRQRPGWAVVAMALGALAKFLPLMLLPALLVYLARRRRSWGRLVLSLASGALIGLALGAGLYRPYWAGMSTFAGVREQGRVGFSPSISRVLYDYLSLSWPNEAATVTQLILGGTFLVYVLLASLRVRDPDQLLRACAGISLLYTLVASPVYWPWYAALPVVLLILTPRRIHLAMILALTIASRLVAPVDVLAVNWSWDWQTQVYLTTLVGIVAPMTLLLILLIRELMVSHLGRPTTVR